MPVSIGCLDIDAQRVVSEAALFGSPSINEPFALISTAHDTTMGFVLNGHRRVVRCIRRPHFHNADSEGAPLY